MSAAVAGASETNSASEVGVHGDGSSFLILLKTLPDLAGWTPLGSFAVIAGSPVAESNSPRKSLASAKGEEEMLNAGC